MRTLNKQAAERRFKREILPYIKYGDQPMLDEAWNDYTDMLCKDGEISMRQYETWHHPKISNKDWITAIANKDWKEVLESRFNV